MEVTECPQCGAASTPSDRRCNYCKAEFFVTSLAYLGGYDSGGVGKYLKHYKELTRQEPENTEGLLGLGLCYLQMGMYPLGEKYFQQIIDASPEISQAYYYLSLSKIKGRRLRSVPLSEVRQLESFLNTALMLDDAIPHYKLLMAMVRRDYYELNGMKSSSPTSSELLMNVTECEVNKNEVERLQEAVKVGNPEVYFGNLVLV